jgi:hypothetical protein
MNLRNPDGSRPEEQTPEEMQGAIDRARARLSEETKLAAMKMEHDLNEAIDKNRRALEGSMAALQDTVNPRMTMWRVAGWIVVIVVNASAIRSEHGLHLVIAAFSAQCLKESGHASTACQFRSEMFGNLTVLIQFR